MAQINLRKVLEFELGKKIEIMERENHLSIIMQYFYLLDAAIEYDSLNIKNLMIRTAMNDKFYKELNDLKNRINSVSLLSLAV